MHILACSVIGCEQGGARVICGTISHGYESDTSADCRAVLQPVITRPSLQRVNHLRALEKRTYMFVCRNAVDRKMVSKLYTHLASVAISKSVVRFFNRSLP